MRLIAESCNSVNSRKEVKKKDAEASFLWRKALISAGLEASMIVDVINLIDSPVLLKVKNQSPLSRDVDRIAVIGSLQKAGTQRVKRAVVDISDGSRSRKLVHQEPQLGRMTRHDSATIVALNKALESVVNDSHACPSVRTLRLNRTKLFARFMQFFRAFQSVSDR